MEVQQMPAAATATMRTEWLAGEGDDHDDDDDDDDDDKGGNDVVFIDVEVCIDLQLDLDNL